MDNTELILAAIEGVHREVSEVKADVNRVLDDHEDRLRNAEKSILRFKTLGTTMTSVAAYLGWDFVKQHFFKS